MTKFDDNFMKSFTENFGHRLMLPSIAIRFLNISIFAILFYSFSCLAFLPWHQTKLTEKVRLNLTFLTTVKVIQSLVVAQGSSKQHETSDIMGIYQISLFFMKFENLHNRITSPLKTTSNNLFFKYYFYFFIQICNCIC